MLGAEKMEASFPIHSFTLTLVLPYVGQAKYTDAITVLRRIVPIPASAVPPQVYTLTFILQRLKIRFF